MALSFCQQLTIAVVQVVGVAFVGAVSVLLGLRILRRQERIKREEENASAMRKLRTDALVRALEAISHFHNMKSRRMVFADPEFRGSPTPEENAKLREREKRACEGAIDLLAKHQFLLGEELGGPVNEGFQRLARAETIEQIDEAASFLRNTLSAWIPPLRPITQS